MRTRWPLVADGSVASVPRHRERLNVVHTFSCSAALDMDGGEAPTARGARHATREAGNRANRILMLLRSLKRATTVTLSTGDGSDGSDSDVRPKKRKAAPRKKGPGGRSQRLAAWEAGRGCEGAARRVRAAAGA